MTFRTYISLILYRNLDRITMSLLLPIFQALFTGFSQISTFLVHPRLAFVSIRQILLDNGILARLTNRTGGSPSVCIDRFRETIRLSDDIYGVTRLHILVISPGVFCLFIYILRQKTAAIYPGSFSELIQCNLFLFGISAMTGFCLVMIIRPMQLCYPILSCLLACLSHKFAEALI